MVTRDNPLQIVPKPFPTERKSTVSHVVTRWSYGDTFCYGLSVWNWENMYGNPCGNACGNALKLW